MPNPERAPGGESLGALEVCLRVVLAEKSFSLQQILDLRSGAVLDFSRRPSSPLDLLVDGSRVARGRAIDVGERLAFLVEEVESRDPGTLSSGKP
jgi:flagellar motor switch/type III secretory pathway protein FliN